MKIYRCEFADAPLELINNLTADYFFSSPSFSQLWRAKGGTPVYWLMEENGQVIAFMPAVEFGRGWFKRLQSMPDGCYSRIVFSDKTSDSSEGSVSSKSDKSDICSSILNSLVNHGYAKIFLNDFHKTMVQSTGYLACENSTYLVDISSPDWAPPDSKLRQQIHKAEKEDFRIVSFDYGKHMTAFMDLVRLHEKRRGSKTRYDEQFFEALAELSTRDNRVNWVWCEHQGRPASSHIFFREGKSIIHWQMYYDETLSQFQSTKLVPYVTAKKASAQGIKCLNLGLSPAGAEGAEIYKRKWGGTAYSYVSLSHKNLFGKIW